MKQPGELTLPADLRYTSEHIWIKKEGDQYVAGVTDYAQDQLGEVAFVDVPCVGETLEADAEFAVLNPSNPSMPCTCLFPAPCLKPIPSSRNLPRLSTLPATVTAGS